MRPILGGPKEALSALHIWITKHSCYRIGLRELDTKLSSGILLFRILFMAICKFCYYTESSHGVYLNKIANE